LEEEYVYDSPRGESSEEHIAIIEAGRPRTRTSKDNEGVAVKKGKNRKSRMKEMQTEIEGMKATMEEQNQEIARLQVRQRMGVQISFVLSVDASCSDILAVST
jgi:hypothetical protein